MKPENDSKSGGKRISFLMPYIDFCFMLIIIFVGMLSIAYFDPTGITDLTVRSDDQQNQVMGQYDKAPPGIERRNDGTGGDALTGTAQPMVNRDLNGARMYAQPSPAPNASGAGPGAVSQVEFDALRRRMQQLQSENARLRNRPAATRRPAATGPGARGTTGTQRGTGTSTRPTGTGTQPAGTGTQPAGTGTQPAGTGTQPAGTGAQPPQNTGPGISDHLYLDLRDGANQ